MNEMQGSRRSVRPQDLILCAGLVGTSTFDFYYREEKTLGISKDAYTLFVHSRYKSWKYSNTGTITHTSVLQYAIGISSRLLYVFHL